MTTHLTINTNVIGDNISCSASGNKADIGSSFTINLT